MSMSCQNAAELLPWLINGTLEKDEEETLLGHLSTCEACRIELEETAAAAQLFSWHIPSLTLAEYAQGLPSSGPDRQRLERHLALCPSCRQELEWATPDRVIDFETARAARVVSPGIERRPRLSKWRHVALAAGIAAALATGGLIWTVLETFSPPATTSRMEQQASKQVTEATILFVDGFESGSIGTWSESEKKDPLRK
jgi:predicted anti-sigma-YlaC factor YlaD